MLPDDHPAVVAELERRTQVRARVMAREAEPKKREKKETKDKETDNKVANKEKVEKDDPYDTGKWQIQHQQLAESRFLTSKKSWLSHCLGFWFVIVIFVAICFI